MEEYISKSALIAEVKRRRESNAKERYFGRLVEDNYFLDFLDTIEVEEVDLEKELNKLDSTLYDMDGVAIDDNTDSSETKYITVEDVKDIAKHFFELGMQVSNKAQKGEKI